MGCRCVFPFIVKVFSGAEIRAQVCEGHSRSFSPNLPSHDFMEFALYTGAWQKQMAVMIRYLHNYSEAFYYYYYYFQLQNELFKIGSFVFKNVAAFLKDGSCYFKKKKKDEFRNKENNCFYVKETSYWLPSGAIVKRSPFHREIFNVMCRLHSLLRKLSQQVFIEAYEESTKKRVFLGTFTVALDFPLYCAQNPAAFIMFFFVLKNGLM